MSIKVLSASTTQALIALTTVKDRLGITGSTYDSRLTALIAEASSAIAEFIGRPLGRQQYLETVSGNARQRITLSRIPVDRDSVTLTVDGTADTDFTVEDPIEGILWKEGEWPMGVGAWRYAERPEENIAVTYKAGWILPDQIGTLADEVYTAGEWVRPAVPVGDLLMECTTGGDTNTATEPTWPTTAGETEVIGAATFTARHALELPSAIQSAAWLTVSDLWTLMTRGPGLKAIESDGQREEYFSDAARSGGLSSGVLAMLSPWRYGA